MEPRLNAYRRSKTTFAEAQPTDREKPAPEPRRRLPAAQRRAAILAAAAELFAEQGFDAPTRTLATRLGISQAALYKHFSGKDEIIEALLAERDSGRSSIDWRTELADDRAPLADRLGSLYARFLDGITGTSMRLFVRAGLDGYGQPGRRGAVLTGLILEPVAEALRRDAGLPGLEQWPMQHEERELAMALHGAVVFLAIRRHVYRMPLPDDLSNHVRRLVRLWLPGALAELRRLYAAPPGEAVPQLAPRR